MRTAVVVIHRQPLVAEAIASALERYPWLCPIAIGSRADDAVRVRSDAVVLDGGLDGVASAVRVLQARGRRVVVLGDPVVGAAPSIGVDRPVEELADRLAPQEAGAWATRRLTAREKEVLKLVAKGLAGKQVASLLGISPKTVEQHKTRIFDKLGVANQAAAVAAVGRSSEGVAWISSTT